MARSVLIWPIVRKSRLGNQWRCTTQAVSRGIRAWSWGMAQKSGWLWAGIGVAFLGAATVGVWAFVELSRPMGPDCGGAGVAGAKIGGPFTLV
ncbi:MAG: hypothetical protein EBU97_04830, partial [Rhodobacteraceae bacterium]|nr:hypothetical protein [Paracoccaceae bacterium]